MTDLPAPGPDDSRFIKGGCRHHHWHGYRGNVQLTDCIVGDAAYALAYAERWIADGGQDQTW